MPRVFLALEIPQEIRENIYFSFSSMRQKTKGMKWVELENIHLTLRFLGEVDKSLIQIEISPFLKELCSKIIPFSLQIEGVGCFPSLQRARVLWVDIQGEITSLKKFQTQIEEKFKKLPIHQEEKEFYPHLTIARVKSSQEQKVWLELLKKYEKIKFGSFLAQEIVLLKSTLTSQGAEYTTLERFKFFKD